MKQMPKPLKTTLHISEVSNTAANTLAYLIRGANIDVATRFGLTPENCPKHPSLCQAAWVMADFARGERYFLAQTETGTLGCVAFELAGAGVAYLNRLSVLPSQQRQGVGQALVQHTIALARTQGIKEISIGVIGAHTDLQRWYLRMGFVPGATRDFSHLPFSVHYMTYAVTAEREIQPSLPTK